MDAGLAIEVVIGLLVVIALLVTLARKIGIAYPILLVLGGLGLGLVPGLPVIEMPPELAFILFLPPILFAAGFFTSFRDFKADLRAISLLAVGLVLATTLIVGLVTHALLPALPLAACFTLGAIVSPPDAVAATAIGQRLGLPRRMVTIIEGESLVNDATALVAYRVAVAATLTGAFSIVEASTSFVVVAVGGVAIGLGVGWVTSRLLHLLTDPPVEILVTMLAPFAAYIPAEEIGVSGVLAAVAGGIFVGIRAPRVMSSETRLLGSGAWQMLLFMLNGFVFVLIGLQLPQILQDLEQPAPVLLGAAAVVSLTVIVVRMLWVFPGTYLPRLLPAVRRHDPFPPWQRVVVLGWTGMRGVVSLAIALALPLDFPERSLVLFLTFAVILATLVGQGLTLPILIRALDVGGDRVTGNEETLARSRALDAAVARMDELEREWPDHRELINVMRAEYDHRTRHLGDADRDGQLSEEAEQELIEHGQIRRAVIAAEREAVIRLRDEREIHDEVLRRLERDLDLEELRLQA